jgi:biopolymer transport protein ExbB/TolQ
MRSSSKDGDRELRFPWLLFGTGMALAVLGPVLGLAGGILGMLQSFHRIESLPAPTPDQLAEGVHFSRLATIVGLVIGCIGVALAALTLVRYERSRNARTAEEPWR